MGGKRPCLVGYFSMFCSLLEFNIFSQVEELCGFRCFRSGMFLIVIHFVYLNSDLVYRSKMPSIYSIYGSRNASLNPVVSETEISRVLTSKNWNYYRRSSYVETHSISFLHRHFVSDEFQAPIISLSF